MYAVFRLLIDNKADVTIKSDKGATPLHIAAYLGQQHGLRYDLICALPNSIFSETKEAEYIHEKDNRGFTACDYAMSQGHTEMVKYIMMKGVGYRLY